jgi:short-subunit dehydrogenase
MKTVLIVGATSAIAQASARIWAARGYRLHLVGRDQSRLQAISSDLEVRGAQHVSFSVLDATRLDLHESVIDESISQLGSIDIALIAHGSLGDQKKCERDFAAALDQLNTNLISVISLAGHLANRMQSAGRGTMAVISSVAGDRGRQSNYIYGTAKGGVSIFLQGLRQRLYPHGVRVVTIKPGFVDTPMTAEFKKGLLWASPDKIATGIVAACDRGTPIAYLPSFWRLIMIIIRHMPESVFLRLRL